MNYRIKDGYFLFRCRSYKRPKELCFAYNNESFEDIERFICFYENSNNRIRGVMGRKNNLNIDYLVYMAKVYNLTESNCNKVNGIEKRGCDYHLDHIVPISYGYENKIPIDKMASFDNLQILTKSENVIKGNKITKEALILLKKWGYE